MSKTKLSEDLYYEKLDRCIERAIENTLIGSGAGLSTLILTRRVWFISLAIGLGTGAGLGVAYAQCSQDFTTPYLCHCAKIKKRDTEQTHDQAQSQHTPSEHHESPHH